MTAADVISAGATVAGFATILVNVVRLSWPKVNMPVPVVALAAAQAIAFLMAMANGIGFDRPAIAFTVMIGISGAGGAMAIAMAQTKADGKVAETKQEITWRALPRNEVVKEPTV